MLPVATPPNAIVYAAGDMRILDMVKSGAFLNVSCVLVLLAFNLTYGSLLFNYANYEYAPDELNLNSSTTTGNPLF
jgi:sodium-dependent dicarboxylate transporter 2/3/5